MRSLAVSTVPIVLGYLLACSSDAPSPGSVDRVDTEQSPAKTPRADAGANDAGRKDTGSPVVRDAQDDESAPEDGPDESDGELGNTRDSGAVDASVTRPDAAAPPVSTNLEKFSFFVTSLSAMQELSKSQSGFGGDLRFGETGEGAGLRGADKICTTVAERSMPGSGAKIWHAFLSTVAGPVFAIDRIGAGPWYDRKGRLVAMDKAAVAQERPAGADPVILNDLPNEDGVPNHNPDATGAVDNHHVLTGASATGQLFEDNLRSTCSDWTKSAADTADQPRVGLMWPRMGFGGMGNTGRHWFSAMNESGCAPGVSLVEMGLPDLQNPTVGSGGGYGAIYCFAMAP